MKIQPVPLPPQPALFGVSVWRVELALQLSLHSPHFQALSPDERARCARYRQASDRARFAGTRVALRQLLAERLGTDPARIALSSGPRGKPQLADEGTLHFNVSHSGRIGLIALSEHRPVGVDVEVHADESPLALLEHVLTPQEHAHCGRHGPSTFYDIWTRKEAVVKALGTGIDDMPSFCTVSTRADPRLVVQGLDVGPGASAALALQLAPLTASPFAAPSPWMRPMPSRSFTAHPTPDWSTP